jgi:hypothetical protein
MRHSALLTGVALVVLLTAPSPSPQQSPSAIKSPHGDNPAQQLHRGAAQPHSTTTPLSAIANQVHSEPTTTAATHYTYNYTYNEAPVGLLVTLGQIAAIVSAIFITVFTCGLLITSRKQWWVANEGMRLGNRAALGIASIQFDLSIKPPIIVVFVQNYGGRLAATKIRVNLHAMESADGPTVFATDPLSIQDVSRLTAGQMMPNVSHPIPLKTSVLSDEQIAAIIERRSFVYIIGFIKYYDGFEDQTLPVIQCYDPGPPPHLLTVLQH